MEKVSFFECVARCDERGRLVMNDSMVDAVITERRDCLYNLRGVEYYRELLLLGDFCMEHGRDREAMSAYMEVLDNVPCDKRLSKRRSRQLYECAGRGIVSLSGSADEVVWEICSQLSDRWRDDR